MDDDQRQALRLNAWKEFNVLRRSGQAPESLEDAAARCRRDPELVKGGKPKNARRFGYWLMPTINPWVDAISPAPEGWPTELIENLGPWEADHAAHAALRDEYALYHAAGDDTAIFEYVAIDAWAFRATWVTEQIERWRDTGDLLKLKHLMTAYADSRGRTPLIELHRTIVRDQAAFKAVLKARRTDKSVEGAIAEAADQDGRSEDTVKRIYQEYLPLFRAVVPSRFSEADFFTELVAMAARLDPAAPVI